MHEKSLKILENSPENGLQYATTLSNMVFPYAKVGESEKSHEALEKSLKLIEKIVGKEHNLYSASLNNLAIQYFNDGNFEKALEFFEKSAEICRNTFGENSANYQNLMENIKMVKEVLEQTK